MTSRLATLALLFACAFAIRVYAGPGDEWWDHPIDDKRSTLTGAEVTRTDTFRLAVAEGSFRDHRTGTTHAIPAASFLLAADNSYPVHFYVGLTVPRAGGEAQAWMWKARAFPKDDLSGPPREQKAPAGHKRLASLAWGTLPIGATGLTNCTVHRRTHQ